MARPHEPRRDSPGTLLPLTITMSDLYRNAMLNKLPQIPTAAPWANDEDAEDAEENETDSLGALPSSYMPPPRSYVPLPSTMFTGADSFRQTKK